jgi:hypothetical protein
MIRVIFNKIFYPKPQAQNKSNPETKSTIPPDIANDIFSRVTNQTSGQDLKQFVLTCKTTRAFWLQNRKIEKTIDCKEIHKIFEDPNSRNSGLGNKNPSNIHIKLKGSHNNINTSNIHKNTGIKSLDLSACEFTTDNSESDKNAAKARLKSILEACPKLEHLNLGHFPPIDDELLQKLPNKLIKLNMSHPTGISENFLQKLAGQCPQITHLGIGYCTKITDASLDKFLRESKKIEELNIEGCTQLSDDAFKNTQSTLRLFNARGCQNIRDKIFSELPQKWHNLTHVTLDCCKNITDDGLIPLLAGNTKLRELSASECDQLTNQSFRHLPASLTYLNLRECRQLTNELIITLKQKCPNLLSLNIEDCTGINGNLEELPATLKELFITGDAFDHDQLTAFSKIRSNLAIHG